MAVQTAIMTIEASSLNCGASGGSRDNYRDLTGQ